MRLAWNEIRHRATRFAQGWKDAHYEKGETQTFVLNVVRYAESKAPYRTAKPLG